MSTSPMEEYLDRLGDLLPAGEAGRVLPEVRQMILDRVDVVDGALEVGHGEVDVLDEHGELLYKSINLRIYRPCG